ncbi:coagulation factor II (thrombin) receptor-like 1, tandem duplicate 2 isoform X1 [Danio aesculapii]|uniref:coagulation factor II (thrombin) receptor-like 1, tandem duplicate 2 isoform X1 n=1 Tax=Danio aesculapii TaxID=1142201 RepID=UPI0024BF69A9|nr:coagulation factor II (thrombin) receptor-like 1, tandem duplicate 2 isoform X1 [Danio aesculapii]
MAVSESYRVLFFFACILFASAQPGAGNSKNRILIVVQDDAGHMFIDQIARETLQSGLTTVFMPIIYTIVFVVGLPTNAMAIYVLLFRSKKVHPAAIYMGNLALADLMFVIWTPLKIAYHLKGNNWTYGEEMCKVSVGFFYGNMYCSILFIACLSVQRYWVCAHPLTQQRKDNRLAIIISVCIWVFIGVSTTPLYLYNQTVELQDLNITTCHDVNIITKKSFDEGNAFLDVQEPYYYFMVMAGLVFFVPMVVIIVAYVLLLRSLGNSSIKGSAGKSHQRAVILIVTVLITFLVCFIPSNVMLVVHYSLLRNNSFNASYGFYLTALCIASLNSCLDPFIYYYVSDDFREEVKNTLQCRSSRTVERMRVSFSSMKYSKRTNTYTSSSGNTETSTC